MPATETAANGTAYRNRVNYCVRFSDDTYASSPLAKRTTNRSFAGVIDTLEEAIHAAAVLGGVVWGLHRWEDRHLDGPVAL